MTKRSGINVYSFAFIWRRFAKFILLPFHKFSSNPNLKCKRVWIQKYFQAFVAESQRKWKGETLREFSQKSFTTMKNWKRISIIFKYGNFVEHNESSWELQSRYKKHQELSFDEVIQSSRLKVPFELIISRSFETAAKTKGRKMSHPRKMSETKKGIKFRIEQLQIQKKIFVLGFSYKRRTFQLCFT